MTRVLVTRQATNDHANQNPTSHHDADHPSSSHHDYATSSGHRGHHDPGGHHSHDHGHDDLGGHHGRDHPSGHGHHHPGGQGSLAQQLPTAAKRLPPMLGGAPTQPLEGGRTSRVVQPGQRIALAVRDGGCVSPACDRPWPGVRPTICGTGWMAAPPTWTTWCCCAGPTIGPCMRAGGSSANPTASSPPPHPIDNTADNPAPTDGTPPPERVLGHWAIAVGVRPLPGGGWG